MYFNFFIKNEEIKSNIKGVILPRDYPYLVRLYVNNRDLIKSYYMSRNYAVKNTHILSRLIEHIFPDLELDDITYSAKNIDKLIYLNKHFKFTSDIEFGSIHTGKITGNFNDEIIICGYDISNGFKNYMSNRINELKSIRFITLSRNDTKLTLPIPKQNNTRQGLNVIYIDFLALAMKYREFVKRNIESNYVLNKNVFVHKYILVDVLDDMIDHIFLNRIMDKYYNENIVEPNEKLPFKIFEPLNQLERYSDEILNYITDKNLTFLDILLSIPLIFSDTAYDLLTFDQYFRYTRQLRLAATISRLKHMVFLYDVAKKKEMSRDTINDWKRLIRRIRNDYSSFYYKDLSFKERKNIDSLMDKIESF